MDGRTSVPLVGFLDNPTAVAAGAEPIFRVAIRTAMGSYTVYRSDSHGNPVAHQFTISPDISDPRYHVVYELDFKNAGIIGGVAGQLDAERRFQLFKEGLEREKRAEGDQK
jgi:hypothetical protein